MAATLSRSTTSGRLRLVELQVDVREEEGMLGERLGDHGLGDVVQILERLGGRDHELHREAARARQRRKLEGEHLRAGDLSPFLLQVELDLMRAALALIPRLEQPRRFPGSRSARP
jgi:hypothetical protein